MIARAVNIYPLSFFINLSRSKKNKIKMNNQHLMFFSGLRGAMAFGLAIRNTSTDSRQLILTTTLVIVIITVIVCGSLTKKMAEWLGIESADSSIARVRFNLKIVFYFIKIFIRDYILRKIKKPKTRKLKESFINFCQVL